MKFFRNILGVVLVFCSINTFSQERVTTFGIQFKPIIPIDFINSGKQETVESDILFELNPKAGLSFGMVIRKGLTKTLSLETGINFLKRKYDFTITDADSSFSGTSSFRLINYEIPASLLVYVRLGDNMFMNVSGGVSVDIYPTPLFTEDNYYENAVNRFDWVQTSLIANIGWEYRTEKSGYFYFGASLHRPFSEIMREYIFYKGFDREVEAVFDLSGNYLTLDLRYFFHEDKAKKKKKKKKGEKPIKKDFRQPRPAHIPKPK
jgi:Outer membrane protein beta-barrel domain